MLEPVFRAFKGVFSERSYRVLGGISFLFFLVVYLVTLPASYTAARIGLVSLKHLTLRLAFFAVLLAALLAVIIPFTAFVLREDGSSGKASTTGGLVVSLVTPLICCSSLLPAVMSVVAAVIPAVSSSTSLQIQRFIVTHETAFYVGAVLLLALALYQNARIVAACPRCRT